MNRIFLPLTLVLLFHSSLPSREDLAKVSSQPDAPVARARPNLLITRPGSEKWQKFNIVYLNVESIPKIKKVSGATLSDLRIGKSERYQNGFLQVVSLSNGVTSDRVTIEFVDETKCWVDLLVPRKTKDGRWELPKDLHVSRIASALQSIERIHFPYTFEIDKVYLGHNIEKKPKAGVYRRSETRFTIARNKEGEEFAFRDVKYIHDERRATEKRYVELDGKNTIIATNRKPPITHDGLNFEYQLRGWTTICMDILMHQEKFRSLSGMLGDSTKKMGP